MGNGVITGDKEELRSNLACRSDASIALSMLLLDGDARARLSEFLRMEFAEENLLFHEALEALKACESCAWGAGLDALVGRFVVKGCEQEVNLSDAVRMELLELSAGPSARREAVLPSLLRAQREVLGVLAGELVRFETSEPFAAYLNSAPARSPVLGSSTSMKERSRAAPVPIGRRRAVVNKAIAKTVSHDPFASVPVRERVLVAEGCAMLGKLLGRMLSDRYEVVVVGSAEEATAQLLGASFAAVLVSTGSLGSRTGLDVVRAFLEMRAYVRETSEERVVVLGMAAERSLWLERQASALGVHAILQLPFSIDEFRRAKGERRRLYSRIQHIALF